MKKIIATIDKKTGKLTIQTQGYNGAECLEATRQLEEGLGMDRACSVSTDEMYNEQKNDQQVGGS